MFLLIFLLDNVFMIIITNYNNECRKCCDVQLTIVNTGWQCCTMLERVAHALLDVNSRSVGRRLRAVTADVCVHVLHGCMGWTEESMGIS